VCDVHEKGTKLKMVQKVIFYQAYCEMCASRVLEENFGIDRAKVYVIVL
jgi:hypothetical protein